MAVFKSLFFFFFFLFLYLLTKTMTDNDYLQPDDLMSPMYYSDENATNAVLIVIDHTQQPVELRDGILKLVSYAPHHNLVCENAMNEESSEYKWHAK
jgi:hypothetical protein